MHTQKKMLTAVLMLAALAFAATATAGEHEDIEMKDVALDKVPDQVKATIRKEAGENEIRDVEKAVRGDGNVVYYDVEWCTGEQEVSLEVGTDGRVMNRETMEHDASAHMDRMGEHEHHKKKKTKDEKHDEDY